MCDLLSSAASPPQALVDSGDLIMDGSSALLELQSSIETFHQSVSKKMNELWSAVKDLSSSSPSLTDDRLPYNSEKMLFEEEDGHHPQSTKSRSDGGGASVSPISFLEMSESSFEPSSRASAASFSNFYNTSSSSHHQSKGFNLMKTKTYLNGLNQSPNYASTSSTGGPSSGILPSFNDHEGLRDFVKSGILHKSLSASEESGSYLVPSAIQTYLSSQPLEWGSIRSLSRLAQISGDSFEVMTDGETAAVGWVSEKGARGETKAPSLHRKKIMVHEVCANPSISQQLLDDAFIDLDAWLCEHIGASMMRLENLGFVSGDGVGKPKGFLSYPLVPVGQGAYEKIEAVYTGVKGGLSSIDVFYEALEAMKPTYLDGAVWYMSRSALTQLRRLKTTDGFPIWQASMIQGQPDMLLGYPVVLSDDMPSVRAGEESCPMVLANFNRGYQIVDRQDMRLLRDPYSSKPFVEFYATKRVGGDVIDFDAFKVICFGEKK